VPSDPFGPALVSVGVADEEVFGCIRCPRLAPSSFAWQLSTALVHWVKYRRLGLV